MEKDIIYKANYMQDIFNTLTEDNLNKLEKHCEKAIHYERKDGILEHQITFDLIQAYKEQQAELEKKDKIIDEMAEMLVRVPNNSDNPQTAVIIAEMNKNLELKKIKVKQYFERKVNSNEQ